MEGERHVLVVDDDKELRTLVSTFLTRSGYRVSLVPNGAEMMQTLADARVDLVILDIMMPGEDGLSLCRRLRASGNIPIIMLTAAGEETDRVVGLEMGVSRSLSARGSCLLVFARC